MDLPPITTVYRVYFKWDALGIAKPSIRAQITKLHLEYIERNGDSKLKLTTSEENDNYESMEYVMMESTDLSDITCMRDKICEIINMYKDSIIELRGLSFWLRQLH